MIYYQYSFYPFYLIEKELMKGNKDPFKGNNIYPYVKEGRTLLALTKFRNNSIVCNSNFQWHSIIYHVIIAIRHTRKNFE